MAKTLYYGGEIITMEENLTPEAILIEDGRIIQIGEKSELEVSADSQVDLKGKVLMPSFIDTNSQITALAIIMDSGYNKKDKKGEITSYHTEAEIAGLVEQLEEQTEEQLMDNINKAENEYFKYGITTIQNGFTTAKEWDVLSKMAEDSRLTADVVCYIDLKNSSYLMKKEEYKNRYCNNLKIGGYKIVLDGCPENREAWVKGGYDNDKEHNGARIYTEKEANQFVKKALRDKQQLLAVCNGDAASQQLIDAYIYADKQFRFTNSIRPVMVNAQLTTQRQMHQMEQIDMIASFFPAHIYYFGDSHIKNFGIKGENMSAAGSALDAETVITFGQNCPSLTPDIFFAIWCACSRTTKEGTQLNEKEKVTVLEALQGVTINAAYQYFEENKKGSIKVGKNADFIIIDKNPLNCDIDDIPNIKILETIKNGETVFKLS